MSDEIVKNLIQKLRGDLESKPIDDFLEELFEKRAEDIHTTIGHNKTYRKYAKKIMEFEEEISRKVEKSIEVMEIIEKRDNIAHKRNWLSEKLMYKQGLLDGISFIIEGTRQINIKKFLTNNNINN